MFDLMSSLMSDLIAHLMSNSFMPTSCPIMSQHYLFLSTCTSNPQQVPDENLIQGLDDGEERLHGQDDLSHGHPVAVALDDVAVAAVAVADAALSVAKAPPDVIEVVGEAGIEAPIDEIGVGDAVAGASAMNHVYTDIVYAPIGDNVSGPGLLYEEIRLSVDDNEADVSDGCSI